MLAIQSMVDESSVNVDLIQNYVSVRTFASSESDDLKVFPSPLQKTDSVGPNGNISFNHLAFTLKFYFNIISTSLLLSIVDESLV